MTASRPYPEARAVTADDIERILGDYARAARNAIAAGFDGVQIHGANGYLVDQFLRDGTNLRDDDYGGPIANRLRFMREVVEAVAARSASSAPASACRPTAMSRAATTATVMRLFTAAAAELERLGVPWIELARARPAIDLPRDRRSAGQPGDAQAVIRARSSSTAIMTATAAQAKLDEGIADAISFGRPFIANPDLVERIRDGADAQRAEREDLLLARARRLHRLSHAGGTGSRLTGSSPDSSKGDERCARMCWRGRRRSARR